VFDTFEEAEAYALNWLGDYGDGLKGHLKVNEPYDYSAYGPDMASFIEIREIE